jgi:hypothetical protein
MTFIIVPWIGSDGFAARTQRALLKWRTPEARTREYCRYGFLWRLYSYWRFQERHGGVFIECRAISLTRDVPFGLGWIFEPIIQKLPKESLINTLEATRRALQGEALSSHQIPGNSSD